MTDLTRAQKTRLGLFLVLATGLFVLAAVVKIGPTLFGKHDPYYARMPNGVGGLEPGAKVTFNGLVVGSVDSLQVDPDDLALVRIELAIDRGVAIPADAKATVAMQGITGSRYVELGGGTNGARRRVPGEEIPAGLSLFDDLAERAQGITERLTDLLDTVQRIADGPEGEHVKSIIAHTDRIVASLDRMLEQNEPRVASIVARLDALSDAVTPALEAASGDLGAMMGDARAAIASVRKAAATLQTAIATVARDEVGPLFARVTEVAAHADELVVNAGRLLGRTRSDVSHALEAMTRGVDSFSDLADMLRSDPSSLVLGRSAKPRELP